MLILTSRTFPELHMYLISKLQHEIDNRYFFKASFSLMYYIVCATCEGSSKTAPEPRLQSVWNSFKLVLQDRLNFLQDRRKSDCLFVRPSGSWNLLQKFFTELPESFSSGVYLMNHSSESIHIWTISTLEGWLSFHDSWPQAPCPRVGLEVKI